MSYEFLTSILNAVLYLESNLITVSSLAVREKIKEMEGPNFYALSYVRQGIRAIRPSLLFPDISPEETSAMMERLEEKGNA